MRIILQSKNFISKLAILYINKFSVTLFCRAARVIIASQPIITVFSVLPSFSERLCDGYKKANGFIPISHSLHLWYVHSSGSVTTPYTIFARVEFYYLSLA